MKKNGQKLSKIATKLGKNTDFFVLSEFVGVWHSTDCCFGAFAAAKNNKACGTLGTAGCMGSKL